jgi:hypothetical protein
MFAIARQGGCRFSLVTMFVAIAVLAAILAAGRAWYQSRYPYGWSHCCDRLLMFALDDYARAHGGQFPAGEASPEASLSRLYPKYADANLLRGKTVPEEVVKRVLSNGGRLGPDTCGWHYVEGLTLHDDRRLALFWDKAGLGHNGEVLPSGHIVCFVGYDIRYIPASEWAAFLAEQERLADPPHRVGLPVTRGLTPAVRPKDASAPRSKGTELGSVPWTRPSR